MITQPIILKRCHWIRNQSCVCTVSKRHRFGQ